MDYILAVKLFSVRSCVSLHTEPFFKPQFLDTVSSYSVINIKIYTRLHLFCNI